MEDQTRSANAPQAVSWGGLDEAQDVSADHVFNQRGEAIAEEDAGTHGGHDVNIGTEKPVIFRNHHGDRYIWPFELCSSFNVGPLNDGVLFPCPKSL